MTTTQFVTAIDLEAMGRDAQFELVHGVLHEMSPSSFDSSLVLSNISLALGTYVKAHRLGVVTFAEAGYILERDPDTVVAPDVAFVQRDRMALRPDGGYFPSTPDLVVEVISATDEPADIRRKQALYDRVGVPLVWWIDPVKRTASIYVPGRPVRQLTESDLLDGESVVPGFSIPLADVFDI